MQLPAVQTKFLNLPNSFSLRNGATLDKVCVAYEQYGTLTPEKDNAILLFHALPAPARLWLQSGSPSTAPLETGNHEGWWNSIISPASRWTRTASVSRNYLGGATAPQAPLPPALRTASPTAPASLTWRSQTERLQALLLDSLHRTRSSALWAP
ncbi:MAG: hypothetical protein ACLT8C_01480 [Akkermansia muciniphila]